MIGTKGFWIDDNAYCEIVGVIDEGSGTYEFKPLEWVPGESQNWIGWIEDFSKEVWR